MHDSPVAEKTAKRTKVQRGISISPELHDAIQAEADRRGVRWNDVVESALCYALYKWRARSSPEK